MLYWVGMHKNKILPQLAIVLPCYNEEIILEQCIQQILAILDSLVSKNSVAGDSYCCFVDDGSSDSSWDILQDQAAQYEQVRAIKLSKNEGHQNALLAGLEHVREDCDCAISTDADMQHEPEVVIPDMIRQYIEGSDIVLGISSKRNATNVFKRVTARAFYRFMQLLGIKTVRDHSDTRLMGQRVLRTLHLYQERKIYLRGIFTNMGFKVTRSHYAYQKRIGGKTKYSLSKMINLALNGISSFSIAPLRFIVFLGVGIAIISALFGLWALYLKFFTEVTIPGWTSIVVPIYFLGGIQLLALGIIGEYVACIYIEAKHRPRYIIEEELGFDK